MDVSISERIIEATKTGDYLGLALTVVLAIPVILLGVLKIYGVFSDARRSNSEEQRACFEILINSLEENPSVIANLRLEEAFKNYYNYFVSADEIRSLAGKVHASQTIREFKKVKKHIIYKKSTNNGGSFIWKKRRRRYRVLMTSVKLNLLQVFCLSSYFIFSLLAALILKNVMENYERFTSEPYDIFTLVIIIFSFLYLAIYPLLEAVKYRDAEIFIAKYGLRSQNQAQ